MKNRNNRTYFTKVQEFIDYVHQHGAPDGRINAVSAGGNGFYVFLWNGSFVDRIKLCSLGVSYVTTEDADKLIEEHFI